MQYLFNRIDGNRGNGLRTSNFSCQSDPCPASPVALGLGITKPNASRDEPVSEAVLRERARPRQRLQRPRLDAAGRGDGRPDTRAARLQILDFVSRGLRFVRIPFWQGYCGYPGEKGAFRNGKD